MIRRDPFAERRRRQVPAGPRPRFTIEAASQRPRRDPHGAKAAETVRHSPRLRLERGARVAAPLPPADVMAPAPQARRIDQPSHIVLVVPEGAGGRLGPHDRQLLGAARLLAGPAGAVAVLGPFAADRPGAAGADRLLPWPVAVDPALQAVQIAGAMALLSARHVLFPETPAGGDLARRVAALTGEPLFTDIERLSPAEVGRAARGGRVEQRCRPPRLLSLQADRVAPWRGEAHEVLEVSAAPPSLPAATAAIEELPADPAHIPLGEAGFVLAAGNGVQDFTAFRALAQALGATPGASRMVCDAGLMPRAAQVGASGTVLTADCYIALGIAGAPQHLQGITATDHVIAVNTDLHAAMIERAELAIVADAQAVMPALLALLRERAKT